MVYDTLTVKLLTMLSGEADGSINALIARFLLEHGDELQDLSVKELASRAHVGTGTVSRFAREAGFESFGQLKEAYAGFSQLYETVQGSDSSERASNLARLIESAIRQVERTLDYEALERLVDDLERYESVSVFGLLKAQAAATDLQVDLLMQGKYAETSTSLAEQMDRIAHAARDELIVIFTYTASYFDYHDLSDALRRLDRPKVWVVCGDLRELPFFVSDRLSFVSNHDRFGHPYQLEYVANLIAQTLASRSKSSGEI